MSADIVEAEGVSPEQPEDDSVYFSTYETNSPIETIRAMIKGIDPLDASFVDRWGNHLDKLPLEVKKIRTILSMGMEIALKQIPDKPDFDEFNKLKDLENELNQVVENQSHVHVAEEKP